MLHRIHLITLVGCCLVVGQLSTGCNKYTLRSVRTVRLKAGSNIAVSVHGLSGQGVGLTALEGYLTAALLGRGLHVKSTRLESHFSRAMIKRLLPTGAYSTGRALSAGIRKGGSMEGDKEFMKYVLGRTEMDDAQTRLAGMSALTMKFAKGWAVHYLLVVHQFDTYGFATYLVHVGSHRVLSAFVVSGTADGFAEALGEPGKGKMSDAKDGDVSRLHLLRLAEYIARNL